MSRKDALEHLHGDQASVALCETSQHLDLDAVDSAPLGQGRRDPPQVRRERQERPECLEILSRDSRRVDRTRDDATGERGDDLLGGLKNWG